MTRPPEDPRAWDEPEADPEHLVEQMRRSIQRVREQVWGYREAIQPETRDEA